MSWKFWNIFKSETSVEEALEHSVGYDLSPDTMKPATNENTAEEVTYAQPVSAQSVNALNLDYTFVFPANSQDGMPQSRFPEPWEKEDTTKKKA